MRNSSPTHAFSRLTGTGKAKRFLGITIEERVLAWDEGRRFAFRVERTSVPVSRAWVEDYRFEPYGAGGNLERGSWLSDTTHR